MKGLPITAAPSVLITGVRLLDPVRKIDKVQDIYLRDGIVDSVGDRLSGTRPDEVIDGSGKWLMPGIVDLAARFREPGSTYKASFASEIPAAQSAGITAVTIPPDTSPPIAAPPVVDRIHAIADVIGGLDVHLLGALTNNLDGESLPEMSALKQAGCVGVSNAGHPLRDSLVGRRALDYAQGLNLTVHVFAQNPALANMGCAHEGPIATRLGLAPIPVAAEVSAIRFWISLVEDTGAAIHFGRLSTARGVELVEAAQAQGLQVSADVAAHQLFLTTDDIGAFNAMCHVIPPLRSQEDQQALIQGVSRGIVSAICSDHQPHDADAKVNPFPMTEPGISGLETLLPLGLELVEQGRLTPLQLAERLSAGPAGILGLPPPELSPGRRANLVVVDPADSFELSASGMSSAGHNSPFLGRQLPGRAHMTVHDGHVVYRRAQVR